MQLISLIAVLSAATATAAATVSYDRGYDEASRSLTSVSCSDGENGLITRFDWDTQGDVSGFPYIGGVEAVKGWNSESCGTCWRLTYEGRTIHVLAVDTSVSGSNIAFAALDDLTDGNAQQFGRVDAEVEEVGVGECGL